MDTNDGKQQGADHGIESKCSDPESPKISESRDANRFLSDGLLIAVFSALSYGVAYTFELGYAAYFNLPRELIRLSLDLCLRAAAGIVSFVFIIILLNFLLITIYSRKIIDAEGWGKLGWIVPFIFFFTYSLISLSIGWTKNLAWQTLLGLVVVAALFVLVGLVNKFSSNERLPFAKHVEYAFEYDPYGLAYKAMGRQYYFICNYAAAILIFAYLAGHFAARLNTSFLITDKQDQILVRNYGDLYVFKNYDKLTATIGNKITIEGPEKLGGMNLERVKIKFPTVADDEELKKND